MNKKLNIVFFGEDSFSDVVLRSLIDAGHNVSMVVTPAYNNLVYKRLEKTCSVNKITFYRATKINADETYRKVFELQPDLCVVAHFERLIKQPLLDIPSMGFINLHPSLLPDYRGMAPQHWPIINREKEAGITVHYVDETADTGDIIIQRVFPIDETMYVSDLQKIWLTHYKTIVVEAIDAILSEKPVRVQKNLYGRYYGKLKEEQCVIDENVSIKEAYSLIRGVSLPYYGASLANMVIYKAHIRAANEIVDDKPLVRFYDGDLVVDSYKYKN